MGVDDGTKALFVRRNLIWQVGGELIDSSARHGDFDRFVASSAIELPWQTRLWLAASHLLLFQPSLTLWLRGQDSVWLVGVVCSGVENDAISEI
jgi:hypothetical protein